MPVPIRADDPRTRLPSEVLAGQNIAGFVLTPADLDRLPTLSTYPPETTGDAHATCRAIQAGEREEREADVHRLRSALQAADQRAAENEEAAEVQADALRAEVARLTGLLDAAREQRNEARAEVVDLRRELAEVTAHRDDLLRANTNQAQKLRAIRTGKTGRNVVIPETFLPTPESPAALRVFAPGLVEYDGHELRITYDAPVDGTLASYVRVTTPAAALPDRPSDGYLADAETWEPDPALGASPEVVALMRLDRLLGNEFSLSVHGTGRARGIVLDALRAWHSQRPARATTDQTGQPLPETSTHPIEDDPRRPHPDAWPDDAVLLRYRELRDLVALHLDRYGDARSARAMRDGDVPLRLAEVLR